MSCEHIPLSLPGLDAVSVPTLQRFLAALMVDRYPTAAKVLVDPLRAITRGQGVDTEALRDALRQYIEFDDDRARAQAGFSEFQAWLTMSINALCNAEQWALVDACRANAKRLMEYRANQAADADYAFNADTAREQAERIAREEIEARWLAIRG